MSEKKTRRSEAGGNYSILKKGGYRPTSDAPEKPPTSPKPKGGKQARGKAPPRERAG